MRRSFYLVLAIILLILLSACAPKKNEQVKGIEKKERAPETLVKVSDGLDSLLQSIDSIEEMIKLTESEFQVISSEEKEAQKKDKQNAEESQEGQRQDGQQQGEDQQKQNQDQESDKQATKTKEEELISKWQEIDKKLGDIHKSWNDYEVEGLDRGATSDKGDEFKRNLNALTVAIENRDINGILDAGSKAFNSLAVFFDLYKDEIRGDLSRVKHSVHQAFILAQNGNKEEASRLLNETQEPTVRIRQKLKDDKVKDLEKLSLAIGDMQKALDSNSIELLKIKRNIAIENIKTLQKT